MNRQLLVSIHDVAPSTLPLVEELMALLTDNGLLPVTLLVVPATGWKNEELERLRSLQTSGAELAGHGWTHRARHVRGWRHRLHSALISRDAAEHLALDREDIRQLMLDCHDWFPEHGLTAPTLYVPPAWALGALPLSELHALPYHHLETLTGVYCRERNEFRRLPMTGYEADTRLRAVSVGLWNAMNLKWAGRHRPLRLGIHPTDLQLRLGDDLKALIREGGTALSYRDL
ncbi:MAG: polysaccharide deacetylase family protein [Pseudohongiellaceae bacterium]